MTFKFRISERKIHAGVFMFSIKPFILYRQECFTILVKFIRNYIRDPSGVFSISSFPALSRIHDRSVQTVGEKWRAIDLCI